MKTINKIFEDSGYLHNIEVVWKMKEDAFNETKGLSYSEYLEYIHKDIKSIKEKLKDQLIKM